jgi:hypothetical protein
MKKNNGLDKIISYIPNLDVKVPFSIRELKIIIFDFLQLVPMYNSLIDILKRRGFIPSDELAADYV